MNQFKIFILAFCMGIINLMNAQEIKVPQSIPVDHPRLLTHGDEGRTFLEKKLAADARTQKVYETSYGLRNQCPMEQSSLHGWIRSG